MSTNYLLIPFFITEIFIQYMIKCLLVFAKTLEIILHFLDLVVFMEGMMQVKKFERMSQNYCLEKELCVKYMV